MRQSRNLLLFLGATLYEALSVLDSLGPDLGGLDSAKAHLIPLRRAPDWREFRDKILRPIRDQVVFHNDPDVLPRTIAGLDLQAFDFATRAPVDGSEPYYDLADLAVIPAAFSEGSYTTTGVNLLRYLHDVIVYAGYYCRAADAVLADVGEKLGFEWATDEAPPEFI